MFVFEILLKLFLFIGKGKKKGLHKVILYKIHEKSEIRFPT